MAVSDRIFARNFARRVKKEITQNPKGVIILSPFLTSQTAETIVSCADPKTLKIYTTFRAETFAMGGSSITTMRHLFELGCKIFDIPNLHAKTILTRDFGIVGSQNLTRGGTRNKEISVTVDRQGELEYLHSEITKWSDEARAITSEMLDEMEKNLSLLKSAYKKFNKLCAVADQKIEDVIDLQIQLEKEKAAKARKAARLKKIRQQKLKAIKAKSAHARQLMRSRSVRSSRVVYACIEEKPISDGFEQTGMYYTLAKRGSDNSFLDWLVKNESGAYIRQKLEKRNRYLLLSLDNGRLCWPALNKTQISQYGTGVHLTQPIRLAGSKRYSYYLWLNLPEDRLDEYNVEAEFRPSKQSTCYNTIRVTGYFSVNKFEIVNWIWVRRHPGGLNAKAKNLQTQVEKGDEIEKVIIRQLTEPFRFQANKYGIDAPQFFKGQGTNFKIQLRQFENHTFLTAEQW